MPLIWSFPISCACRIEMYFEMPIPNYWTKKKRSQFEIDSKDDKKIWHIKKPDVTNMRKLYEDCLEKAGILSNDSVIVCGETQKYYSSTPRTIIIIKKMESP
jgi:Holliday junction resolvase RusA-like endonuclease